MGVAVVVVVAVVVFAAAAVVVVVVGAVVVGSQCAAICCIRPVILRIWFLFSVWVVCQGRLHGAPSMLHFVLSLLVLATVHPSGTSEVHVAVEMISLSLTAI